MGVHTILLIVASLWVLRVIPPKVAAPREVDFMPTGGGGGDPALLERSTAKQHMDFSRRQMGRISAKGLTSDITLPDPFESSRLVPLEPVDRGRRTGGLGGDGSGGGMGAGRGKGFGTGTGIGSGKGNGTTNPFGMIDPDQGGLVGTFYNFNMGANGQTRFTYYPQLQKVVNHFVNHGWDAVELAAFHEAPRKLYVTRIYMPSTKARNAPHAFGQRPDDRPCWMVVYRGTVTAPKSGKFRFVGAGDDLLVVRFAGRNVFDYGYGQATTPDDLGLRKAFAGNQKLSAPYLDCPMEPPLQLYKYPGTSDWNANLGGMAVGPAFEVTAGQNYPIEILIGEGQGGLFAAGLLIEEVGASYSKAPTGAPVIPIFRTDPGNPTNLGRDNSPPFDPNGPVWKVADVRNKI